MKKVAIIGGGPSGICSAKYCSSYGLEPVVFEMNSSPGGLWISGTQIWSTMHCNFTKYSMAFSDFPWPDDDSFFYPHRDQMNNYLQTYIEKFDLLKYFNLNCCVISAKQTENSKWNIEWINLLTKKRHKSEFDFLITACGFISDSNVPKLPNKDAYKGLVMHSSTYRVNDENLKNKRVLVVGSSNSSVEIASDLVGYSKSVINLFNRPFWVIPKFVETKSSLNNEKKVIVPRDFLFYTRKFAYDKENKYQKYSNICPDQANKETCPPDLYVDPESKLPANFGISEHYYKHVKEGRIETKRGFMKQFTEDGIELTDGSVINADVVLFCTGYKLDFPFFEENVLKAIKFEKDNYKNPIVLYKYTYHPSLPNTAFIFLTRGLFFVGLELQCKWAASIFSEKMSLPSYITMKKEVEKNELKRKSTHPSVQFPHGLYVEVVDELAKEMGVYPEIKNGENEKFWNYLLLPSHFIYNENEELCNKMIEKTIKITNYGVKRDIKC